MSVKNVYGLSGIANSGKTSTLSSLIDILREKANKVLLDEQIENDYRAIFLYNSQIIAVSTQGDNVSQVKKHIKKLEEFSCDVIFCATRSKGATCSFLSKKYGSKLRWIENCNIYNNEPKSFDNSEFISHRNKAMANLLFSLIQ